MKGRVRITRKAAIIATAAAVLALAASAAINARVICYARPYIVRTTEALPRSATALVLGAAVWRGGRMSHILEDRAITARDLYRRGVVGKILVSGAHSADRYNEVSVLKAYFLEQGVDGRDLFLDHAGFDTYSSMVRARAVFSVKEVIVVTQEFHQSRALYIARKTGLSAWGYPADRRPYVNAAGYAVREYFSRLKAFLNVSMGRKPRFLGPAIPITGDGRASW